VRYKVLPQAEPGFFPARLSGSILDVALAFRSALACGGGTF
jgi:hypothetical protein